MARDFSHIYVAPGRPSSSAVFINAAQQPMQSSTSEGCTDKNKQLLWRYIQQNEIDTPESLQELKHQINNNEWDEIRLKDWVRRNRQSVAQQKEMFTDTDIQIMQAILDSKRHWRTAKYMKSLTCILQRANGPVITEDNVVDWMSRMQYMDSRNGIISTTKTVKSQAKRNNLCKVQDVPKKISWNLFQKSESHKVTSK